MDIITAVELMQDIVDFELMWEDSVWLTNKNTLPGRLRTDDIIGWTLNGEKYDGSTFSMANTSNRDEYEIVFERECESKTKKVIITGTGKELLNNLIDEIIIEQKENDPECNYPWPQKCSKS